MKQLIAIVIACSLVYSAAAQQVFIEKASIEFEVKTNVKKTIGNGMWADMLKENMPQFKTGYYKFNFSDNKSIYKFDRWAEGPKVPEFLRRDDETNVYFFDYTTQKIFQQKAIVGSEFLVQDSIPKINWRITNESREIAGFNCRKAVGVILDSVYVFAFYTDEIVIPGGPCSINGLPGMILGMTIPRLYTSFMATKVSLTGVNETEIKPVAAKKYSTRGDLRNLLTERSKEWYSDDNEDSKNWRNQFIWSALL
ncbi:MAG TPA: GLPGLI family protein [Ferruginibacter sp.]|nr:GLPGLI family protein [Ferruginibacter sp.]HPH92943.1 GLPGLI family protein [Ferruginibacter sp.]